MKKIFLGTETLRVNRIIENNSLTRTEVIENEIRGFKLSRTRRDMLTGERYYRGEHDILKKKRTVIGEGGELFEVENLPNNRIIDNQYARMVDQKNNYLLSKPFTVKCSSEEQLKLLNGIFDEEFFYKLKAVGEDSLNCGIGYLYVYFDENKKICFKRLKPFEVLPFFKDSERRELDFAVRLYETEVYEGKSQSILEMVEIYTNKGIELYELVNGKLFQRAPFFTPYFSDEKGKGFGFLNVPVIVFKQNSKEIPLINRVKSLQDSLNLIISNFMNNLSEDVRNTILVLKNYDGTNLGEFRQNLSQYGAVKVKSIDGAEGGVETLKLETDTESFRIMREILKKAIVENACGVDSKDERLTGNVTRMNIQSVYSDIDLDANSMETEFKESMQRLTDFIFLYAEALGLWKLNRKKIDFIFNRDILINETESIENCKKSKEILSERSILEQHPWVCNADEEERRIKKERGKGVWN